MRLVSVSYPRCRTETNDGWQITSEKVPTLLSQKLMETFIEGEKRLYLQLVRKQENETEGIASVHY